MTTYWPWKKNSGGLHSGGLLGRATDFESEFPLTGPRKKTLGVYTLGVYTLGVYSAEQRISDPNQHLLALENL